MTIYKLTETCSVAGQIQPADVHALQENGFVTIVCNRPDDEDFGQPTAAAVKTECDIQGVAFHHLPISNAGISAETVKRFQEIVAGSNG